MTEQTQQGVDDAQAKTAGSQDQQTEDTKQQAPAEKGETKTSEGKRIGDIEFTVPEEYKNEKWTEDLKSGEDVWKKLAGAQKLIGRKGIIPPDENAPQEEWDAYYNERGRPESPEGYELKTQIEELKNVERNVELDNKIKNVFHKLGLSKDTAEKLTSEYERVIYEAQKPALEKAIKIEQEFQKLTNDVFGSEKQQVMEQFKTVMRESLGDKPFLAQKLETLDNDALVPLMAFAKNLHDKYVGESGIPVSTGKTGDMTGDLRTDYRTISEQKMNVKLNKDLSDHVRKQKLQHLNNQLMKIGEKAEEQGINLFG
jgi:hypothetical protein